VVGLADLTLGLLPRDLLPGTGHLDRHHDGTDYRRGDDQVHHGVNDEADHGTDDQERDQYAGPDGGDLEPAHPPHLSRQGPTLSRDIT
jgi:hypothetical protein